MQPNARQASMQSRRVNLAGRQVPYAFKNDTVALHLNLASCCYAELMGLMRRP
jgi:hypothetical protein